MKKTIEAGQETPTSIQGENEVEESGDLSLVSKVSADGIVAAPGHKRDANPTRKRANKGSTATQEEVEQAEKCDAGAYGDETGKPLSDKVNHKMEKNKKLHNVLAEVPQPDPQGWSPRTERKCQTPATPRVHKRRIILRKRSSKGRCWSKVMLATPQHYRWRMAMKKRNTR